jgi:hypothetical protein
MVSENHVDHVESLISYISIWICTQAFCDFELVVCLFQYVIYIVIFDAALMLVIFLVCFFCNSVKILECYIL